MSEHIFNKDVLTKANDKAYEQGLSNFKCGFKYHEAFIYWCIKQYPNNEKLGAYIRKIISDNGKENPYNEYMTGLSNEVNKIFKNK